MSSIVTFDDKVTQWVIYFEWNHDKCFASSWYLCIDHQFIIKKMRIYFMDCQIFFDLNSYWKRRGQKMLMKWWRTGEMVKNWSKNDDVICERSHAIVARAPIDIMVLDWPSRYARINTSLKRWMIKREIQDYFCDEIFAVCTFTISFHFFVTIVPLQIRQTNFDSVVP